MSEDGVACDDRSPQSDLPCTLNKLHPDSGREHFNAQVGISWPLIGETERSPGWLGEIAIRHLPPPPGDARWLTDEIRQQAALTAGLLGPTSEHRSDLARWWRQIAEEEINRTVPKAEEYGSTDLVKIGQTLAESMDRSVSEAEAAELGVYFYLVGKMARWTDAVTRGDQPSDDTLFDIGIYVRMAQRIRTAGGWPNGKEDA